MITTAVDAETERCAQIAEAERDRWPGGAAYAACNLIVRKIRREAGF